MCRLLRVGAIDLVTLDLGVLGTVLGTLNVGLASNLWTDFWTLPDLLLSGSFSRSGSISDPVAWAAAETGSSSTYVSCKIWFRTSSSILLMSCWLNSCTWVLVSDGVESGDRLNDTNCSLFSEQFSELPSACLLAVFLELRLMLGSDTESGDLSSYCCFPLWLTTSSL